MLEQRILQRRGHYHKIEDGHELHEYGSIRICLDPRDLNKAIKREHYQLPTFDETASRLTRATRFTRLDSNKGYWQIPLDEQSSKLATANAPYGRHCFL